jgi:hypothetical protein
MEEFFHVYWEHSLANSMEGACSFSAELVVLRRII